MTPSRKRPRHSRWCPTTPPDAVGEYIRAPREFVALSKAWENPQTGGIKQEYVGDFQRLVGVLEDTTEPTARFVGDRCPGTRLPESLTSRLDRAPPERLAARPRLRPARRRCACSSRTAPPEATSGDG